MTGRVSQKVAVGVVYVASSRRLSYVTNEVSEGR